MTLITFLVAVMQTVSGTLATKLRVRRVVVLSTSGEAHTPTGTSNTHHKLTCPSWLTLPYALAACAETRAVERRVEARKSLPALAHASPPIRRPLTSAGTPQLFWPWCRRRSFTRQPVVPTIGSGSGYGGASCSTWGRRPAAQVRPGVVAWWQGQAPVARRTRTGTSVRRPRIGPRGWCRQRIDSASVPKSCQRTCARITGAWIAASVGRRCWVGSAGARPRAVRASHTGRRVCYLGPCLTGGPPGASGSKAWCHWQARWR